MQWKIITDSGSNIREINNLPEEIYFDIVPLILTLNDEQFIDNAEIDTEEVVEKMAKADNPSTACPAPGVYAEKFEDADNVLCFTLSSEVSGSYNSAELAKDIALEKNPDANIHIFDTKSAGGEMDLLIYKAIEFIKEGKDFEQVITDLDQYHEHTFAGYMLQSVDNLVKNGRVNKVVGSLVGLLNINVLGIRSEKGEIEMSDRVRGEKRAIRRFIKDMKENGLNGQKIEISHVNNRKLADHLADKFYEEFPDAAINIRPTSGLCSFYAEDDGLIVGYERN
ncbi:MAG: DegV family protein [Atopostipes suicloacalis]|nr:DegV family protein [Atopostipes suicloacalis]